MDEERDQPAPNPLSLPLGGHALADLLLERGMRCHMQAENEQLRAQIDQQLAEQKPTYKEVYERFHRRRARNPKVTIREVCKEMGVNYDNIRAAKYRATKKQKRDGNRHKKPSQNRHKTPQQDQSDNV